MSGRQCVCPECVRCGCGTWERHHTGGPAELLRPIPPRVTGTARELLGELLHVSEHHREARSADQTDGAGPDASAAGLGEPEHRGA